MKERLRDCSWRHMLFRPHLLDDALQDLWCALLKSECRPLTRYRADRGSLEDYLAALAWEHLRRRLREARRRGQRQVTAVQPSTSEEPAGPGCLGLELAEVVALLTPTEQAFFRERLLGLPPDGEPLPVTAANAWQLRHRILQKVLAYLGRSGEGAPGE